MKLYLMRHGHSPSVTEAAVASDFDRPLSPQGRQAVRAMAEKLKASAGRPAVVLHSPLKRAEQTAREAAAVLSPAKPPRAFVPLSNELGPEDLATALSSVLAENAEVLAVGHQPQLGELAAWLAGDIFELRPGGLIALEVASPLKARSAVVLLARNPGDPG